jgi:16S rRNA (guanine966-N2)-methyltransferase
MRIIAGRLGSRHFDAPKGLATHPMGDRVRTALFNTLGDISGLTVLDAFSGSGALSFEALSRGAKHATILEIDRDAYKIIANNIEKLGLTDRTTLFHINARSWSYRNNTERFDLVFCDPPYNQLQETVIEKLAKHTREGGIMVLSLPPHGDIRLTNDKFELLSQKSYGDATLAFFRRTSDKK